MTTVKLHEEELDLMENDADPYWGASLPEVGAAPEEVLYTLIGKVEESSDPESLNYLSAVARVLQDFVREARLMEAGDAGE